MNCIASAPACHRNRREMMNALQHEFGIAQTYLTIAKLAYDMGQAGRGDQARERALEACSDAAHMMELLAVPAPAPIIQAWETIREALAALSPDAPAFAGPVRQPSMS
ncbi:MAG: hypothetical protein WA324_22330 [Bryobacteraceae bacterium]